MPQLFSYLASGDCDRRASCRTRATHFWHQIKSLKAQNVQIFPLVNLICFCRIINPFSWIMNAFSSEKRCPSGRLAHKFATVSRCTAWSRELVSFVRPRELVSFDPWHVTRSRPIGKRIWVVGYNNGFYWHNRFRYLWLSSTVCA